MVAYSRVVTDIGPLQIYLMLSEIDKGRAPDKRMSPETVRLLASKFSQFNSWYLVFTEFPDLNDESITRFVNVAIRSTRSLTNPCVETLWGFPGQHRTLADPRPPGRDSNGGTELPPGRR